MTRGFKKLYSHAHLVAPHEFELIPFPVKALKLLLHDLHTGGDAAAITAWRGDVDTDDGVGFFKRCDGRLHNFRSTGLRMGRFR